jgi:hypothetical protein
LGLVKEKQEHNSRIFYYLDPDNYFGIPTGKENLIKSIYARIKSECNRQFNKDPTKTHVNKILYDVNKKLNLGLPIGWYRYGPFCVVKYKNDEQGKLNDNLSSAIAASVRKYCPMDNFELQRRVYEEENNPLYMAKENLLKATDKAEIHAYLLDIIRHAPLATQDVANDYTRATMLLGWDKTKPFFDLFWKYVTMVNFQRSLDADSLYFEKSVELARSEIQSIIVDLVNAYMDSKYSQDAHYQQYVKKHQSGNRR